MHKKALSQINPILRGCGSSSQHKHHNQQNKYILWITMKQILFLPVVFHREVKGQSQQHNGSKTGLQAAADSTVPECIDFKWPHL